MQLEAEIIQQPSAEAKGGWQLCSSDLLAVWSCGGGRQSCAIAVLIIEGKLPKPDYAVIADTGRELFTTFPYIHKFMMPELAAIGVKLEIVKAEEWSYYGTRFVDGSGDLMLPVYTMKNGVAGKNMPDCSGAWKRDTINHWLSKTKGVTRSQYCKWIGFSRSPKELIRASRMRNSVKEGGKLSRFPLIELGLNTPECLKLVKSHGWPEPKVSACWMCPNLKDSERMELTDEEKRLAIEFDRQVRAQFPGAYLHGECRPLEEIELSQSNDLFTDTDLKADGCETGGCFV
jgi:hypothetical protein